MKIKYLIDTLLSNDIKALDFVGRYGGIVSTIHTKQDDFEANGKGTVKKYPVACDVNSVDCANLSIYQDLVPNDDKISVVYWEEVNPMTNVGETATKSFYQRRFRGTARLIFWANLAKLGSSTCNGDMMAMQLELERVITRKGKISGGLYNDSFIRIQPVKDVQQDINTVFGKYDYPKELNYYLYPFGFFAVDVEFEIDYCIATGANVPVSPAIDCYNQDGTTDCEKILALLTDELKLTCVLPTYNFADTATQDALTDQQDDDLRTHFITNATCLQLADYLTQDQLLTCVLPLYDFTDAATIAALSAQQKQDLKPVIVPLLDYTIGFDDDFNLFNPTQIADLTTRLGGGSSQQYSMLFDGFNEGVNCYNDAAYNFTNLQPFTITSWVKSANYAGNFQGVMTKRSGTAGGTGWSFYFYLGDLYVLLQAGIFYVQVRTNGVTFTNNVWCHVAATISGSGTVAGVKIYRNGVQLTTAPVSDNLITTIVNTSPVLIGNETALSMPFNGNIGYSRLFNIEFSGAQVITDYNSGVMLEESPEIANQVLGWKAGQGALFGTPSASHWYFPNELDGTLIAPFSSNMEITDRTTDVPV